MTAVPNPDQFNHKRMLVDEATGAKYSGNVGLWPFSEYNTPVRIWTGEITVESPENAPLNYKLRCYGKTRLMKYWKCYRGSGTLKANDVHYIIIKVPEEAIYSSKLTLILNDHQVELIMFRIPRADVFYWGVQDTGAEKKEKEPSRWEMVDKDLLKNLPSGVANYIKENKELSLRRLVFRTVQPIVYQMLIDLGRHAQMKEADRPEYFDVFGERSEMKGVIMEYVLQAMAKNPVELA